MAIKTRAINALAIKESQSLSAMILMMGIGVVSSNLTKKFCLFCFVFVLFVVFIFTEGQAPS
jgi:hypothetical protein